MIPDRASNIASWEFDKLVVIVLRQFKRLLSERGVELTDARMQQFGGAAARRESLPEQAEAVRDALRSIVDESIAVLQRRNLTFAQSLAASMDDIPGWESTADFLEIANEKGNAEIRITAGSALLVIFGDASRADLLLQAIDYDLEALGQLDVDAIIGQRALLHVAMVDPKISNWRDQVAAWIAENQPPVQGDTHDVDGEPDKPSGEA